MTQKRIVIVTGLSGAGKSEALKCLEDMGFECIDNMPLSLMAPLLSDQSALPDKLALGVDVRTRELETHASTFAEELDHLKDIKVDILYLTASPAELLKRFSTNRRRHPLAMGRPIDESLALEETLLAPLKDKATFSIDTSGFTPANFWSVLEAQFDDTQHTHMQVFVTSFGFKHGMPTMADMVFDVRHLKNPHWEPSLKPYTGESEKVRSYVKTDDNFTPTADHILDLLTFQLPIFETLDRPYATVAIGCTGGAHRSVTMAMHVEEALKEKGFRVTLRHRDIDKHKHDVPKASHKNAS